MTDLIPSPTLDTWTPDELITADLLNSNIRDAQKFLAYAPVTIVSRAAAQSIPAGTQTPVVFDTEYIDVDGMFTAPSANLTVQRPGVYSIQFEPHFQNNTTDIRSGQITVNGTMVASNGNVAYHGADTTLNLSAIVACQEGDVIQGTCWQDTGANLNIGNGIYFAPRMAVRLLSTVEFDVGFDGLPIAGKPPAPSKSKPPTAPKPTKHTTTFGAIWSRSYDGNTHTMFDDTPYCFQGDYDSNRGNSRSLIGFDYGAIQRTLRGATSISGTFSFKVRHTYYNAGSPFRPTVHNYASKPANWVQAGHVVFQAYTGKIPAGHVFNYRLTSQVCKGFQSGIYRGMGFGPTPASRTYYGYTYGANQGGEPKITFTYYK